MNWPNYLLVKGHCIKNKFVGWSKRLMAASYKARLVVKGFQQKESIELIIFSSVTKLITIKLVLCIFATKNLVLEQIEVKTIIIHNVFEENIYTKQL